MTKLKSKLLQLPKEQLEWFLSFEDSIKENAEIIDVIERKAFKRGYLDLVLLLDSDEFIDFYKNYKIV